MHGLRFARADCAVDVRRADDFGDVFALHLVVDYFGVRGHGLHGGEGVAAAFVTIDAVDLGRELAGSEGGCHVPTLLVDGFEIDGWDVDF